MLKFFIHQGIFTLIFVYTIGWLIPLVGVSRVFERFNEVLLFVYILGTVILYVSYCAGVGVKRLNPRLAPFLLAIFWVVRVVVSFGEVREDLASLKGFTDIGRYNGVLSPKVSLDHESNNYLVCILGGREYCFRYSSLKPLIYRPYQVCNIMGGLFYKGEKFLKTSDILNGTYLGQRNVRMECTDTFVSKIFKLRDEVVSKISQNINEPQASLLEGIIFGTNLSFDEDFEKGIKAAGISHVVAASGYNVSILITALDSLLGWSPKKLGYITKLLFIWFYALLTGFSSSMVRACAMTSALFVVKIFNLRIESSDVFGLAVATLILISPFIAFDLGFLLSAGATWGLIYLSPILEKYIKVRGFPHTTLACTLSTLPIILAHFNVLSPFSIIANMLILPVIEIVMILGVLGLIMKPFLYVAYGSLKFVEIVALQFAKIPYSIIELDSRLSIAIGVVIMAFILLLVSKGRNGKSNFNNN